MNSIYQKVGCSLNWFVQTPFPTCATLDEMKQIQRLLRRMKNLSSSQFPAETGCLVQCSKLHYKLKDVSETDITWRTDWVSEVGHGVTNEIKSYIFHFRLWLVLDLPHLSGAKNTTHMIGYFFISLKNTISFIFLFRVICWETLADFWGCSWAGLACLS